MKLNKEIISQYLIDKKEIYLDYSRLPEDDGTFIDYFNYYMEHPQKDPEILKRACIELSVYCHFCMNTCVYYKSLICNKYVQCELDNKMDYTDYEIHYLCDDFIITKNTDLDKVDIPNIKGLINMLNEGKTYRELFRRLLRGETFLNENEIPECYFIKKVYGVIL